MASARERFCLPFEAATEGTPHHHGRRGHLGTRPGARLTAAADPDARAARGLHEYYVGAENWTEAAAELDLRVLRNERVEIAHGGGAIDLAGVNDITGAQYAHPPDYERTLAGRDQSRPVVLMAHQPVAVHDAAPYGVDLQLSGHTHGGQMFPFDYLVGLQQPVVSGFGEVDGTPVYVTNGAGFWGPPVRVGADPDITLLTLRSTA
ncbi:putative MPP superfamily phosphohydrolase [Actinoplanes lobatus]|uniref:Putative MPP superfamily phosphohydrolase n=1 Tax=Actinoplanes lobatus TaxID=113568 RepID=A0A7W7HJH5_9ACTN|nr:putative MPP superfamily phosphohydrolase [Actinoplanes lobatus]